MKDIVVYISKYL
uniref:Uncharacterized protein MANES_11G055400 n=1 Tax=Rhizophora mucronata TaxID=61149 RepID=A0A2P2JK66_RHIMU